jgi:hypothetical protein
MGSRAVLKGTSGRRAIAAVALLAALLPVLAACEYTYDEVRAPLPTVSAPPVTDAALPRDPSLNRPVSGDQLKTWAADAVPNAEGQTFYSSSGLLEAGGSRTEQTVQLPEGLYAVTLACRGIRRVSFTVENDGQALIDLPLQCGTARVNVVQLPKSSVLTITVKSNDTANFAYRVTRF